jgi:antitoxin (DNA-binding transcriptional repressor) of toxin-antitoxin stability system
MKSVSVSILKAQLSHYLREVARGGEIQIVDRGVPIARLTRTPPAGEKNARRERLAASGIVRLGKGGMKRIIHARPLEIRHGLSNTLREDREDRV